MSERVKERKEDWGASGEAESHLSKTPGDSIRRILTA